MQDNLNDGYESYRDAIVGSGGAAEIIYVGNAWRYVHDNLSGGSPMSGESARVGARARSGAGVYVRAGVVTVARAAVVAREVW